MRLGCSICRDPVKADYVNRGIQRGWSMAKIESSIREGKAPGIMPMKYMTIHRHKVNCLAEGFKGVEANVVATLAAKSQRGQAKEEDIALLVQKIAAQRLRDGDAKVTTKDGLDAQRILDRRAEKASGRELALTIAALLFSQPVPDHVLPMKNVTIEGIAERIE